MRIIAIGDTHGRNTWERIIEKEVESTREVFVGDYFDSWTKSGRQCIDNFSRLVAYKRANPERVKLVMGNHEFHYIHPGERYSGFNDNFAGEIAEVVKDAISDNSLQMCHQEAGYIFTHGGITKTWCEMQGITGFEAEPLGAIINRLFLEKPSVFCFDRRDISGCGEDSIQSPIWVRPNSLIPDMVEGYTQIVGHTTQTELMIPYDGTRNLVIIDTIGVEQYLIIEDEGMSVGHVTQKARRTATSVL